MKLRWTRRAANDLHDIGRFIARHDHDAARAFLERLRERARKAAAFPRSGRMVPEFRVESIREAIEGNYRIVYHVGERTVDVLTIFEGHRTLGGFPPVANE